MEDLLQRCVGSRIAIEVTVSEHLPQVSADTNQVELALLNLAVNARDAMPDGGTILIELKEVEQQAKSDPPAPGRYVALSVIDQGQGMDSATLQKAIEPFFFTKELGKGTGLGLSMVHGLALQLDGWLKLTSTPGKGTTADLWIPVSTADVTKKERFASAVSTPNHAGPKRILPGDDDVLIAMSSADMLSDLGHEVVEVHSGKEALDLIDNGASFDLLITDYSMPGITGAELAKAARDRVPGLPILLASGYADLPSGQRSRWRDWQSHIPRINWLSCWASYCSFQRVRTLYKHALVGPEPAPWQVQQHPLVARGAASYKLMLTEDRLISAPSQPFEIRQVVVLSVTSAPVETS